MTAATNDVAHEMSQADNEKRRTWRPCLATK
jgi:ribosomal protein L28